MQLHLRSALRWPQMEQTLNSPQPKRLHSNIRCSRWYLNYWYLYLAAAASPMVHCIKLHFSWVSLSCALSLLEWKIVLCIRSNALQCAASVCGLHFVVRRPMSYYYTFCMSSISGRFWIGSNDPERLSGDQRRRRRYVGVDAMVRGQEEEEVLGKWGSEWIFWTYLSKSISPRLLHTKTTNGGVWSKYEKLALE